MRSVASGNSTGSWVSISSGTGRLRRFGYARIHTLIRSLQSVTWSITDWPIPPCHQVTSSCTKKLRHLSRYIMVECMGNWLRVGLIQLISANGIGLSCNPNKNEVIPGISDEVIGEIMVILDY
jgi:hypothetical protein